MGGFSETENKASIELNWLELSWLWMEAEHPLPNLDTWNPTIPPNTVHKNPPPKKKEKKMVFLQNWLTDGGVGAGR